MATRYKPYPDVPRSRRWTFLRDAIVVVSLVFFVVAGVAVYRLVDGLQVLADGLIETGTSIEGGFDRAADAVGGLPIVGESLRDGLASAGNATGGELVSFGVTGQETVHRLAVVLGWLIGLVPPLAILVVYVPIRLRRMRELGAASLLLAGVRDEEHVRLLAMRAALTLPYRELARYTTDPFGDLVTGRYGPLLDAALDDAGVLPAHLVGTR